MSEKLVDTPSLISSGGRFFKNLFAAFLICTAEMILFTPLTMAILMPLDKIISSPRYDWIDFLIFEAVFFCALAYVNPTKISAFTEGFRFAGVAWMFYAFTQLLTAASIDLSGPKDVFNWRYIGSIIPVIAAIAQSVLAWKLTRRRPSA